MPRYQVTLAKVITCVVEVDADDESGAIDEAYAEAPRSICAQCGGWGEKWSVDDDPDWETINDFYDDYTEERYGKAVQPA